MTVEEQILTTLCTLTSEQQRKVLDFAEFLRQRSLTALPETPQEPPPLPVLPGYVPSGWKEAICGDY